MIRAFTGGADALLYQYGKNLDWKKESFTMHDVASVFRRYLTMMPEPVIPYNLYSKVRFSVI